jgi:hypothetical protein
MAKQDNTTAYRIGASQTVTVAGTAANNATPLASKSGVVRLHSTTACRVAIGPGAVAVATSTYLAANAPEYFAFNIGDRVSVIQQSAGGTLTITEMTR